MTNGRTIVIIGGGISGLAAAHYLSKLGLRATVLDQGSLPGGTMQSVKKDGWLVETGPNSALETTPLFRDLFRDLDLEKSLTYAAPTASKRYVMRNRTLHVLPMSALSFLKTPLWSTGGKLRLLKEPFIGRAGREETVGEFVERRLGREILDYAIDPFVAGVFAGDPSQLSVRAAFPKLYGLEERYGGLIRGTIAGMRERRRRAEKAKDRAKMFSFLEGMQTLPLAISRRLGESFHADTQVLQVARCEDAKGCRGFRISAREGGRALEFEADAVILAVPAFAAELLVRHFSPPVADALGSITYPPVAEVFLGYPASSVGRALDGFGFLIPAKEDRKILGTIWSSSLFPQRAPEGHVAFTTFVGGSRQPSLGQLQEIELIRIVTEELREILNISGEPTMAITARWAKAIPQYDTRHLSRMSLVDQLEKDVPGLYFCSNFRGGIAVGDCIMSAERTAERILKDFG